MVLSSLSSSESTVYRLMSISDVRIVYEEVKVYNIVYRAMYIMGIELLPSNNKTRHGIRKSRNDVFDCGAISAMVLPWRVNRCTTIQWYNICMAFSLSMGDEHS